MNIYNFITTKSFVYTRESTSETTGKCLVKLLDNFYEWISTAFPDFFETEKIGNWDTVNSTAPKGSFYLKIKGTDCGICLSESCFSHESTTMNQYDTYIEIYPYSLGYPKNTNLAYDRAKNSATCSWMNKLSVYVNENTIRLDFNYIYNEKNNIMIFGFDCNKKINNDLNYIAIKHNLNSEELGYIIASPYAIISTSSNYAYSSSSDTYGSNNSICSAMNGIIGSSDTAIFFSIWSSRYTIFNGTNVGVRDIITNIFNSKSYANNNRILKTIYDNDTTVLVPFPFLEFEVPNLYYAPLCNIVAKKGSYVLNINGSLYLRVLGWATERNYESPLILYKLS